MTNIKLTYNNLIYSPKNYIENLVKKNEVKKNMEGA